MESNAKPAERTGERSLLRFWGLVFLLGPLPVCGSFALLLLRLIPNEIGPVETCGFFGALWGLASGIRSRTLSRAILGLNGGVLAGSGSGWLILDGGPGQPMYASIVVALAMGLLTGFLRMHRPDRLSSFVKGVAIGFFALLAMSITFFAIIKVLPNLTRNEWFGVMSSGFISSALGIAILLRGMRSDVVD